MRLIKKVICPLLAVAIIFSTTSVYADVPHASNVLPVDEEWGDP